jgi:hypothetical protein
MIIEEGEPSLRGCGRKMLRRIVDSQQSAVNLKLET